MLSGFQVVRRLSDGASAEVLLARSQQNERVIVEVLRPELQQRPDLVQRFLREAVARRRLVHRHLARRVAEGRTADGRPYLVSELIGDSLASLLRSKGPLSVEELLELTIPLCQVVHYLHQNNQVHGNIKPATVFLPVDGNLGEPKLVDYGLALLRPGRTPNSAEHRILVEAEYLAPERVRGQRGTPPSDIYALGVLMYEALTGFPPFKGDDSSAVRRMQCDEAPPRLPASCAAVAPIIERCLAKQPADRFPSAFALRNALLKRVLDKGGPADDGVVELIDEADSGPGVGNRLGTYELVAPLGEGAMGRVFLARHATLGRQVAIKILKPEHAADRDLLERFFQEARAVNRIDHEHIVQIFDFVDEASAGERRVYCVMEALSGRTLRDLLKEGPMAIGRGLAMLRQVCSALDAAHRVGVVHRDIKPDNIFIVQRNGADFVKVLDFGVAKLRGHDEWRRTGGAKPQAPKSTSLGEVLGTPAYMPPEQALGCAIDHRVDVYALGVVLYRMLAGHLPFRSREFIELINEIAGKPTPPLPERSVSGERIPSRLRALAMSCLEKDPERRPQGMAEIGVALESIAGELSRSHTPPPVPKAPPVSQTSVTLKEVPELPVVEAVPLENIRTLGAAPEPTPILALLRGKPNLWMVIAAGILAFVLALTAAFFLGGALKASPEPARVEQPAPAAAVEDPPMPEPRRSERARRTSAPAK